MKLKGSEYIHFIGIGGVGMSAIALVLLQKGYKVSGSDTKSSNFTARIEAAGGRFYQGHRPENINGAGIIVFSSSIPPDNPELKSARDKKIRTMHRADILALLMNEKKGVAVSGAHGKTTTSSLIAHILFRLGLKPTIVLGGEIEAINGNALAGEGDYFVAEADESDGSFVHLKPFYSVITNIDEEHLDYYRNMGEIIASYMKFIEKIKAGGKLFACGDCLNLRRTLRGYSGRVVYFGLSRELDIYPEAITMNNAHSEFDVVYKGRNLGRAALSIPGAHNISNAMAAFAVALETGLGFKEVTDAIGEFKGAGRRFQQRCSKRGITVIDDYAHHPAEISATIAAAKGFSPRRLIVVFQPHRFSRTKFLRERFGGCFGHADHLVLTDVYAASEDPLEDISGGSIYEEVKRRGHKSVVFFPKKDLKDYLLGYLKEGDMILFLGAGDVTSVSAELARELDGVY